MMADSTVCCVPSLFMFQAWIKTTPPAAWSNGKYRRVKGATARRIDWISQLEVRIAFHRRHRQVREENPQVAKIELAQFLDTARDFYVGY